MIADDPAHVTPSFLAHGPLEPERVPFEALPMERRLYIAEGACRRAPYAAALLRALPEDPGYELLLHTALDGTVSEQELGRSVREMLLAALQRIAHAHHEDLGELA
jgi:hypothetical protein